MSYWEFIGSFLGELFSSGGWYILSGVLAALVIIGTVIASIVAGFEVADRWHWAWNFLVIPAIAVIGFLLFMLLGWSALGVS